MTWWTARFFGDVRDDRPIDAPAADPDREVEIVATDRPRAFLVRVGGRDQSLVDLDDPTRLGFDYVRRMADVLDALAGPGLPLRAVHVGGAGLTLPRYVTATRPGSRQVVLEPDERLTERVRAELPLPRRSGIRVRPVDGRTGLETLADAATERGVADVDVVVLDAYDGGQVPGELLTVECFAVMRRVLAPTGVLLANLSDRAPFTLTRSVLAGLQGQVDDVVVSAEPATLRGRRAGNLLVVAGALGSARAALLRGATTSAAPYRVVAGNRVADRFGGGSARHD